MNISIYTLGQPSVNYIQKGETEYLKRLKAFTNCQLEILATKKIVGNNIEEIKSKEADLILAKLEKKNVQFVLLDEAGKEISSLQMAKMVEEFQLYGRRDVVFLIEGAYGVDERIKARADRIISLSKLTLPHQLVRLIFLEQLYRAFTILKGLPYHHE